MYSQDDFNRYYGGTWVRSLRDPTTFAKVADVDGRVVTLRHVGGAFVERVPFDDLVTWENLKWPTLGWRSIGEHGEPVYVYRGADSQTRKGFSANLVRIYDPLGPILGKNGVRKPVNITLREIFNPTFLPSIRVAVDAILGGITLSAPLSPTAIVMADLKSSEPKMDIYSRRVKIGEVSASGAVSVHPSLEKELVSWV